MQATVSWYTSPLRSDKFAGPQLLKSYNGCHQDSAEMTQWTVTKISFFYCHFSLADLVTLQCIRPEENVLSKNNVLTCLCPLQKNCLVFIHKICAFVMK